MLTTALGMPLKNVHNARTQIAIDTLFSHRDIPGQLQLSEWKHYTGMTTSRPRMYLGVWLCRVMCPEDLIHLIAILADRLYVDIWRMPTSQVRTPAAVLHSSCQCSKVAIP